MYPKNFDSAPTSLNGARFCGHGLDADSASDAESTATIQLERTDTKASEEKLQKVRRGGKKEAAVDEHLPASRSASGSPVPSTPSSSADQCPPEPAVPVLGHFDLRSSSRAASDNNRDGESLFASTAIKQGTRLICEAPLLSLPAPGNSLGAMYEAFEKLSEAEQESIWCLRPAVPPSLDEFTDLIDSLIALVMPIYEKDPSERTTDETRIFTGLAPKLEHMCRAWRIAARFHANKTAMTIVPAQDRASIPPDTPITGLFAQSARLRHSCVPNCHCTWNPRINRMTVHAVKNIDPNEELTVSCIGIAAFYHIASERRAKLLETLNLTCHCEACNPTSPTFATHELLRAQLHSTVTWLGAFLTTLDIHENPHQHAGLADYGPPGPEALATAEKKTLETLVWLQKAGCADLEIVRWRNALRDHLLPRRGEWVAALAQAKLALARARICWGGDHPDIPLLEREVRHVEDVLSMEKEREKK